MRRFESKRIGRLFLGLVLSVATFSACLKDEAEVDQISAVRALNAVPGSGQFDIGLDQNQLNFDRHAMKAEDFAYGDTLPYKNAWPGNRWVRVFETGSGASTQPVVQGTVQFLPGRFYSLYVVGHEELEVMITEDDLSAPEEGKAKIRFVHLSPDAPALDFGIAGEEAFIASNKAFKGVEDFSSIDAGETYRFNILEHRNGNVIHTFEFAPSKGMIYTIWAKGLIDHDGDTALDFGHDIIVH
ncbi:DUF4397 domain-containing protein [Parapedobacter deserti]|uniref:DUF4397 domain-containing protein n=1 Tax=Parapedobacter deserti TaxID=1912957 RepID=A0ABV7JL50_9SPHI